MRIFEWTIPASFTRIATGAFADHEPADVRSLQKLHENHNALYTRRIRRNVWHHNFRENTNGTDPVYFGDIQPDAGGLAGAVVAEIPVMLTPGLGKIIVDFHAQKDTDNLYVYAALHRDGNYSDTVEGVSVTAAVKTSYAIEVWASGGGTPIPGVGMCPATLTIYVEGLLDSTNLKSGNITAAGPDWCAFGGLASGDVGKWIYVDGDTTIEPRRIRYVDTTAVVAYLTKPWNKIPAPTVSARLRDAAKIGFYDISVHEATVEAHSRTAAGFLLGG